MDPILEQKVDTLFTSAKTGGVTLANVEEVMSEVTTGGEPAQPLAIRLQVLKDFVTMSDPVASAGLIQRIQSKMQTSTSGKVQDGNERKALSDLANLTMVYLEGVKKFEGIKGMENEKKMLYFSAKLPRTPAFQSEFLKFEDPDTKSKVRYGYPTNAIMLFGPPGTGKSVLVKAFAKSLDAALLSVKVSSILSRFVGGSAQNIDKMFDDAIALAKNRKILIEKEATTIAGLTETTNIGRAKLAKLTSESTFKKNNPPPCVLFLDEIDFLAPARSGVGGAGGGGERSRDDMIQFMTKLDTVNNREMFKGTNGVEIIVLAATNVPDQIDLAVMRRFGKKIFIDVPTLGTLISIFFDNLGGLDGQGVTHVLTIATILDAIVDTDFEGNIMFIDGGEKVNQGKLKEAIARLKISILTISHEDALEKESYLHTVRTLRTGSNAESVAKFAQQIAQMETLEKIVAKSAMCEVSSKRLEMMLTRTERARGELYITPCFDGATKADVEPKYHPTNVNPTKIKTAKQGGIDTIEVEDGVHISFLPVTKQNLIRALTERKPDFEMKIRQGMYDYAKTQD